MRAAHPHPPHPAPRVHSRFCPLPDGAPAPESAPPTLIPDVVAAPAEEPQPAPAPVAALPVTVAKTVRPASVPALPAALLDAARRIADTHRADHEVPVMAAQLGTRMGVALPVASAALAQL
ncbi:hypothetical protein ACIP5L_00195 [Streptomyces bacillaris]|uniref:hypothetical protein n=1 Tax=Streptomyces bacillaris TaxID=68179 RepID=UPI0037F49A4D